MTEKKSKRKRLFLIDGYATLYRSHFALIRNPLITSYGLPTSALFGFTNQVLKLLRKEKPDYLAAVFDTREKTFRHERFPEYKATREKMPDELQEQLPHLWNLLNAMQIITLSKPGFEADDIIGTLAREGSNDGLDVFIVSGDKDFMQLVNDHVFLYTPGGRSMDIRIYDSKGVEEKWGVPPEKMIDFLGLMGDASDNIPGVRGVGEKSAKKLIIEFGSLENALKNAEKNTNKRVRNGLLECKENALLSKELVTIDTNVELDCEVSDLTLSEFDTKSLRDLFQEFEFFGLVKQLDEMEADLQTKEKTQKKNYETITDKNSLKSFVASIKKGNLLSLDLETTSVDPMQAEIVGLSFSIRPDSGVYIPLQYKDKGKNHFGKDELSKVMNTVKPILEDSTIPKTGQNVKFDALIYKRHGVDVHGIVFDTMIAAHLSSPETRSYKLDKLALEFLNYRMVPIEELIGSGRNQITMAEVDLKNAAFYAAEDADVALQLTKILEEKLGEHNLLDFFNRVELPLLEVLLEMEYSGTYVDVNHLDEMSSDLAGKLDSLSKNILKESGTEFNINSTQQLAQILFDVLELPKIKKRSTAEDVLKRLQDQHPLPGMILQYRKMNKLKNTYLDPLKEYIHPETGRIHSSFNQTVAATGRLSSTNPNFQNIPIRTDEGREIRKAFRAREEGWKIFSADYSQVELRIMAHLSQDPGLMKAFQNEEDVHARTASLVFGVPLEDVLPEMRRTAKIVNFGIMYGAGPFRMSQELGIPRGEGMAIIEAYFNQYAGIKDYIDRTLEQARKQKWVTTMLGRRRPVWEINSQNQIRRQAAERMAINMPIQGTAAEMIKLAMISIHEKMRKENLKTMMILQVHDELIFEVPKEEIDKVKSIVISEMESALSLSVPIVVDWGIGDSWYEAH
ncbi:MAG TPA: DNA polymerase I [Candidatus Marinimicrobia bacterium]|jgi:DNA polymerase-1|nr:DNA polymerase I [Candidatus Neomarinimicrobiota bacterium]MDP6260899.1 DNA polymerase I [Candidatus Neomarinimicrobiota bacterium]MDP7128719.1 DNA polymerase I [Candidatus Neomarinimicrobiota bacterium]MDP7337048.1 DNA polymerase I [Candidatus Neomarinimicrobiota bacterium]MDP7474658.1 DNA polymerase I [Candidatus Neomarinimicrobiota bacterium]|tara:strand:- start:4964 stop:7684 length:2721 start_codon:yes stop_codon:yes gene_type:complete